MIGNCFEIRFEPQYIKRLKNGVEKRVILLPKAQAIRFTLELLKQILVLPHFHNLNQLGDSVALI